MKIKLIILSLIFLCFLSMGFSSPLVCFAEGEEEQSIMDELDEDVSEQLSTLDFENLQNVLDDVNEDGQKVFGSTSFMDKVSRLINGDFGDGFGSFFDAFTNVFLVMF